MDTLQDTMVFRNQDHVDTRAAFIVKTYNHLFGAILAFILFEVFLFSTGLAEPIAAELLSIPWIAVLGIFMLVAWGARSLAYKSASKQSQYAGLVMYVVIEGIIFVPLLYMARAYNSGVIVNAGVTTLGAFAALTAIAHMTKKDFSFLGGLLRWGGVVAIALIISGAIFGFHLGTLFTVGMIGLAGAAILYDTSKIIHDFGEDQYVGAALELFASVALMLWYVIRLFMSRD